MGAELEKERVESCPGGGVAGGLGTVCVARMEGPMACSELTAAWHVAACCRRELWLALCLEVPGAGCQRQTDLGCGLPSQSTLGAGRSATGWDN